MASTGRAALQIRFTRPGGVELVHLLPQVLHANCRCCPRSRTDAGHRVRGTSTLLLEGQSRGIMFTHSNVFNKRTCNPTPRPLQQKSRLHRIQQDPLAMVKATILTVCVLTACLAASDLTTLESRLSCRSSLCSVHGSTLTHRGSVCWKRGHGALMMSNVIILHTGNFFCVCLCRPFVPVLDTNTQRKKKTGVLVMPPTFMQIMTGSPDQHVDTV